MKIDIKDILKLDDNKEYVVVSKTYYNDTNYYYLLDKEDYTNMIFCYEKDNKIMRLEDKELITILLPLFYEIMEKETGKLLEK